MASKNLPGDDRAYQIQVPCVVFFVATTFVVTVRLWARIKLRSWSGIGWDDGTIVASWMFTTTVSALMMASCSYGFGQHVTNLTPDNQLMTLKLFYVAQAFYKLTINLTKASILLLYLRIFVKRWFGMACYVLLVIILSYMVATFTASVWQCTPVARAWDKSIPGTCINISSNWKANSGFSIATDFIILALPMYPIYASMLPRGQKVALVVVFALGVFTTITSILRLQTLDFKSPDITYDIDSSIWTMIEENLAIICACLPVCRFPLAYAFPAYFSTDSTKGLATSSLNKDRQSYASTFPANLHPSPVYNQDGADQKEKSILDNSPPTRPSTTSLATVGWEADPESGRYNMLSHVCTCGTSAVNNHVESCGSEDSPGPEVESDSRVIRMITHYSITYDDNNPPDGGS